MKKALLALESGVVIEGKGAGVEGISTGELVFNTSFTGYEEALTDPSYKGQILMFTYPLIGNYGIQSKNPQSDSIQPEAIVAEELTERPDNPDSIKPVKEYLEDNGSRAIFGVDTRELTLRIRERGTVKSAVGVGGYGKEEVLAAAKNQPPIEEKDLIPEVSTEKPESLGGTGPTVVVIDTGVKKSILKDLGDKGFEVKLLPHDTGPEEVEEYEPDGIFFTNGPGDPENALGPIETARWFLGDVPTFGICFGAQIISLAVGGKTYKLKFGHRGANQPVKDHDSGVVNITAQNHGFAIDRDSLDGTGLKVTETNAIDGTVEAVSDENRNVFAVQYHPEASPGPKDNEASFFNRVEKVIKEDHAKAF